MITAKNLRKPFRSSSSITFTKQTAPLTEMLVKGAINVEKDLFSMLCLLIFLLSLKNKRKSGQTPLYKKRGWDRGAKLLEIRRNTRKLLLKFWGISTCFRRSCFCSHHLDVFRAWDKSFFTFVPRSSPSCLCQTDRKKLFFCIVCFCFINNISWFDFSCNRCTSTRCHGTNRCPIEL